MIVCCCNGLNEKALDKMSWERYKEIQQCGICEPFVKEIMNKRDERYQNMNREDRHIHMNRLANCKNRFQGNYKRVLCVCSAGLLRSPTTAVILSQEPYNYNTRAAGIVPEYALIPVDEVLLDWADEIVCMEDWQGKEIEKLLEDFGMESAHKVVKVLNVPDNFPYRDEELSKTIKERYDDRTKESE